MPSDQASSPLLGEDSDDDMEEESDGEGWEEDHDLRTEPPSNESGQAAVVLAGFYLEEVPGMRFVLDEMGGHGIVLIPCTPDLLHQPLGRVLQETEPAWHEPMPSDWVHGGGWGQQRVVVFANLE